MIEHLRSDGILTLRLAHGKAGALDIELLEALSAALDEAGNADAVVLTGSGGIFSAGVDLPRLVEGGPEYARRFVPLLDEVLEKLFALPRPVVAAVNGHAIAGGCILAMACDHRLMAVGKGRIGIPELRVSVPFPAAALGIVEFAVSPTELQWMLYGGDTMSPEDALESGFIDEILALDRLLPRAMDVAGRLVSMPAENFSLTKRMLRADALERMRRRRERFGDDLVARWTDPETHAGIRDYVERTLGQ